MTQFNLELKFGICKDYFKRKKIQKKICLGLVRFYLFNIQIDIKEKCSIYIDCSEENDIGRKIFEVQKLKKKFRIDKD